MQDNEKQEARKKDSSDPTIWFPCIYVDKPSADSA